MTTIAARIVDFLGDLHGMDHVGVTPRVGALDLHSGAIYEEHADWPDGERLSIELQSGKKISVATHKVVQHFLVRHAEAMAVVESTRARDQFDHISDHFDRKTGFDE